MNQSFNQSTNPSIRASGNKWTRPKPRSPALSAGLLCIQRHLPFWIKTKQIWYINYTFWFSSIRIHLHINCPEHQDCHLLWALFDTVFQIQTLGTCTNLPTNQETNPVKMHQQIPLNTKMIQNVSNLLPLHLFFATSFIIFCPFPGNIVKLWRSVLLIYPGDFSTPKSKLQSVQTPAPALEDLERKRWDLPSKSRSSHWLNPLWNHMESWNDLQNPMSSWRKGAMLILDCFCFFLDFFCLGFSCVFCFPSFLVFSFNFSTFSCQFSAVSSIVWSFPFNSLRILLNSM